MADPLRSADKAYYASKQPLNLRSTREGRKNPTPAPSYRHKGSDSTASSDKYYAAAQPAPAAALAPAAIRKSDRVNLTLGSKTILPAVIAAFGDGASEILLHGTTDQIRVAQAAIDMAVGRNTLTRPQADAIGFVIRLNTEATPVLSETPAPDTTAPAPDTTAPAPDTTAPAPDVKVQTLPEVEELMPPPPKAKKSRGKKKVEEPAAEAAPAGEEITEADVAAAFGVVEEGDD